MADTVSTNVIFNGAKKLVVQLNSVSDGTGESAVIKVDKSTFTGLTGLEPSKIVVEYIDWVVDGMSVKLAWDRTTDVIIGQLTGSGYTNYTAATGAMVNAGAYLDDTGTGDTGDIYLTTTGHSAGDSYKILLGLRKIG